MKIKMGRWLFLSAFAILFKDITRFDDFNFIQQYLKQTKKVDTFVMSRAKRGLIEYQGDFSGSDEEFLETMKAAANGRFQIELQREEGGLTITLSPLPQ